MAESITGNVTGKVGFKIDKKSWDTLEKFKSQLTNIKRQMSTLHKTVKVQAVVKQVADVNKKIVKAQEQTSKAIVDTKVKMARKLAKVDNDGRLAHLFPTESSVKASNTLLAKQMVEQQKILDKANKAQFAADLKAEKDYNKRRDMLLKERAKRNLARSNRRDFFNQRADMYQSIKLQQAKHAGVDETGLNQISSRVAYARKQYQNTGDIAAFRNEVQLTTRALIHQTRQMNANAVTFRTLRTDIVQATAAYTAFSGLINVAQTGMDFETIRAASRVFAGPDGVAGHLKYVADEADRLGINFRTAAKEFTKFSIATKSTLTQTEQRDIFKGVSEYARVMGISNDDFQGTMRAINQIASKGQLYKEDVSGQLGERLAGSVDALRRALGYETIGELYRDMEQGILSAKDALPKLAKELSRTANEGGALSEAMGKFGAQWERFVSQVDVAKDSLWTSGLSEGLGYAFRSFTDVLKEMQPVLISTGGFFKGFFQTLTTGIQVITTPLIAFGNLLGSIFGKDGGTMLGILAGGALFVSVVSKMATGIMALRAALLAMTAAWAISPMGLVTRLLTIGGAVAGGYAANALMNPNSNVFSTQQSAKQKVEVSIGYKTEEAKKLIDAQINTRNTQVAQDLSMQVGGV